MGIYNSLFYNKERLIRGYSLVLIMWMCALGGLSVYTMLVFDIKCLAIAVVIGRCLAIHREKRKKSEKGVKTDARP